MTEARLLIERVGSLATIQDHGRPGWRRFGVPPSGPVDRLAHAAANIAVGNPAGASAIEVAPGGLTARCEDAPIGVALTGSCDGDIDDAPIGGWTVAVLHPGMRLRVRDNGEGRWGYLALAGSLICPTWLGSTATHVLAGLGGGTLKPGTALRIENTRKDVAGGAIPKPPTVSAAPFRIVPGPQERFFDAAALSMLGTAAFAVGGRFDRMGTALDGPRLLPLRIDMPSEPTLRGALQVDGDGRLTMLTADHQTTGGYPRIATVVDADVDRLAQAAAGSPVRLRATSAREAIDIARAHRREVTAYLDALPRSRVAPSLLEVNLIDGVVDARASIGDAEIDEQ